MFHNKRSSSIATHGLICALSVSSFFAQKALASRFDAEDSCKSADSVEINAIHRGETLDNEFPNLVRLDLPSAGILTLDITGTTEPRISSLNHGCGSDYNTNTLTTIERSAGHLTLAVRDSGTYYFRLGAQDPRQSLERYKLASGFVPATVIEDELGPDDLPVTRTHFYAESTGKVGEEDTDPGGGGLWDPSLPKAGRLLVSIASLDGERGQKVGEEDTDPGGGGLWDPTNHKVGEEDTDPGGGGLWDPTNHKGGDEDTDPGGGGFAGSTRWVLTTASAGKSDLLEWARTDAVRQLLWPDLSTGSVQVRAAEAPELLFATDQLCRWNQRDDHSDSLRCSTPIGANQVRTGEIANDWGDDTDTFTFSLVELQTVRFQATGEIEADMTIYDRFGHQLKRGIGDLVSTLGPGDYFVRVAASHPTEGLYELEMEFLEW